LAARKICRHFKKLLCLKFDFGELSCSPLRVFLAVHQGYGGPDAQVNGKQAVCHHVAIHLAFQHFISTAMPPFLCGGAIVGMVVALFSPRMS
jgi:hypothetical protein